MKTDCLISVKSNEILNKNVFLVELVTACFVVAKSQMIMIFKQQ